MTLIIHYVFRLANRKIELRTNISGPFAIPGHIFTVILNIKNKGFFHIVKHGARVFHDHHRNDVGTVVQEVAGYFAGAANNTL
ncbi:hypothetical protein D3C87_1696510 [compost metagenome]